jgi:5-methylcytosine-specific restriction endonuclease McrBC GTP-binding regulatory subunit McrB
VYDFDCATTDKLAVDVVAKGENVQFIGNAKIGKLSAKGNDYPQLRLPHQYSNVVGEVVRVFETEHEGKRAFLILTGQKLPQNNTVLKPSEEVLKQRPY